MHVRNNNRLSKKNLRLNFVPLLNSFSKKCLDLLGSSKHFLERIVYLVDTFYNLAKLLHGYSDTSQHRKIFARSEYKSIAQTALYECSRFVVGGGEGHRTCAPRGSPPENKWDSIEDLIIRLR